MLRAHEPGPRACRRPLTKALRLASSIDSRQAHVGRPVPADDDLDTKGRAVLDSFVKHGGKFRDTANCHQGARNVAERGERHGCRPLVLIATGEPLDLV